MEDSVVNLIIKRMDDHKEETNRRFDALNDQISEMRDDVKSLTKWKWTTKGKLAGISLIMGAFFYGASEYIRSLIK